MKCSVCPRKCNVDRTNQTGFCLKSDKIEISKVMLHFGEEPFLTKNNKPSGAIFFAGCNLKCEYCQNFEISRGNGRFVSSKTLADLFLQLEQAGASNIDLVTPTHYASQIAEALKIYKPKIPVIYNCGGYESVETIKNLLNLVDVFLFDLKYFDDSLAIKYSKAPNYFSVATKAIDFAIKHKPNKFEDGQLISGVAVRHLCLPNHVDDSLKVLDWLKKYTDTPISIMSQYVPYGNAKNYPEINRKLKPLEYRIVLKFAQEMKNKQIFVQDLDSATEQMIPDFCSTDSDFDF